ncbi:MAG: ABC transporter permease [bacterium]
MSKNKDAKVIENNRGQRDNNTGRTISIFKQYFENHRTGYGILMVLFFWYIIHYFLQSSVVPAPHHTIIHAFEIFLDNLWIHLLSSLGRILAAILISLLLGVSTGLFLGMNKKFDRLFTPVVYILYPIPKIAFLPVLMILLGLGDLPKVLLITIIIIFQIIVTTRDAVRALSKELFYSVKSLGMNKRQTYRHMIIPAVLPKILTSLRISVGTSVAVLFFAENFATQYGIGYFIMNSWSTVNYLSMFSGILVLSLMGLGLFKLIDFLESKLCAWVSVS